MTAFWVGLQPWTWAASVLACRLHTNSGAHEGLRSGRAHSLYPSVSLGDSPPGPAWVTHLWEVPVSAEGSGGTRGHVRHGCISVTALDGVVCQLMPPPADTGQHCPRDIRHPQDGGPGARVLHVAAQQHSLGGLIYPKVGGPPPPPGSVPLKVGEPLTTSAITVGTCPHSERSQRKPVVPGPVNGLVQLNARWISSHPGPRRTPSLHGASVTQASA